MEIVKYPDKILFQKAQPVDKFDQTVKTLAAEMRETMGNLWGNPVGLAAPQVGHSIRMFIALDEVYVNPEIRFSKSKNFCKEGCYSLEKDKLDYPIWRAQSVWINYQDLDGNHHEKKLNGFAAEVVQHEFDHLEGRLCYDPSASII